MVSTSTSMGTAPHIPIPGAMLVDRPSDWPSGSFVSQLTPPVVRVKDALCRPRPHAVPIAPIATRLLSAPTHLFFRTPPFQRRVPVDCRLALFVSLPKFSMSVFVSAPVGFSTFARCFGIVQPFTRYASVRLSLSPYASADSSTAFQPARRFWIVVPASR